MIMVECDVVMAWNICKIRAYDTLNCNNIKALYIKMCIYRW